MGIKKRPKLAAYSSAIVVFALPCIYFGESLPGDTGLRGYPLRYQMGDKKILLTIEQRYFTDWYRFRLFQVGGAAFLDAGEAWGDSPVPSHRMGVLRNASLGLRLGSTRSGVGRMIHVDIVYALDGETDIGKLQFLVSTKKSFQVICDVARRGRYALENASEPGKSVGIRRIFVARCSYNVQEQNKNVR